MAAAVITIKRRSTADTHMPPQRNTKAKGHRPSPKAAFKTHHRPRDLELHSRFCGSAWRKVRIPSKVNIKDQIENAYPAGVVFTGN
jgi:hypothetical protein